MEGGPVYNIPYRDIGAVASDLNGEIQDREIDLVLEHEKVIETVMDKVTVLPMRFHTILDKKEDVLAMMKDYYSGFEENLDRLRNKVEFGIKVILPADKIKERIINAYRRSSQRVPVSGDSPAKSFLKEKFEKYKIDKNFEEEVERCIGIVEDFVGGFATEKKLDRLNSKTLLLNAVYLVEKERQDDFREAFERLRRARSDLQYLFSGPWPAYNFVALKGKIRQ